MLVATLPLFWRLPIYLLAGVGAGIANGIAGGGTFITFPTLLATGASALDRERHDDRRRRAELPRGHPRFHAATPATIER